MTETANPSTWEVTPVEAFKRLSATIPEEPRSNGEKQRSYTNFQFDLAKWIADKDLDVIGPHAYDNGQKQKWIFRICPWNADHTNRSAVIIQFASGAISASCRHNGCAGKSWHDLRDIVEPGWRNHKTGEHANSFVDCTEQSSDQRDARVIDTTDQDLPRLTKIAWDALLAMNNPPVIFRHGNFAARIERDDADSPMIRVMNVDRMRHRLARVARWCKRKRKSKTLKSVMPPLDIVRDVIATPDLPLPVITRIVEVPVYTADGTLQIESGYHPASQSYYEPPAGFVLPGVPERPSATDIERARQLITEEILGDFPFVSKTEMAHAVGFLLLPFIRDLIPGPTPFHLVEKPSPGTGASLLTDILVYVAIGRPVAVLTEARDEDEWRKRITAKLMTGPSVIVIDNIGRRLESSALSAAITAPVWEDRVMGLSQMVRIPVRCAWIGTGNNPNVSSEIARRTVRIRLDAKVDRPWLRDGKKFRHPDLKSWVAEHRGDLVWAVLTLARTWIAAGRPVAQNCPMLGMFEDWTRVTGGILEVSGVEGFLKNLSDFYEQSDAEGAILRAFVAAWWQRFKDKAVGVSELFEVATALDEPFDLGEKGERSQKIRLGKLLAKARDRQFGDLKIVSAGEKDRAGQWKLEKKLDPWD